MVTQLKGTGQNYSKVW